MACLAAFHRMDFLKILLCFHAYPAILALDDRDLAGTLNAAHGVDRMDFFRLQLHICTWEGIAMPFSLNITLNTKALLSMAKLGLVKLISAGNIFLWLMTGTS